MSSTNRSRAKQRHLSDYYVTPVDHIMDFLRELQEDEPDILKGKILDPCAGGDKNNPMSYPKALIDFGVKPEQITTIDIRDDSLAQIKSDYLLLPKFDEFDVIITNPPFALSQQIIEKALQEIKPGGFVIMLLRLNYFGGKKRKLNLWNKHMPKYAYVHSERMSFTGDGRTDSIEYMHCVWQGGYYPRFTNLKIIDKF